MAGHAWALEPVYRLAELLTPLGAMWMQLLRVAVVPLVVVQTMVAVLGTSSGDPLARTVAKALILFVGLLVGAAVVTALVSPVLVTLYVPPPELVEAMRASVGLGAADPSASRAGDDGGGLLPFLVDLATGRHILPLLVAAVVVSALLLRLPEPARTRVPRGVERASALLLRAVAWILLATPLAVFIVLLEMSLEAGAGVAGVVVVFIAMMSGLLVAGTVALYGLVPVLSRVPLRSFARAVAPAQLVALSTRSSIAALPALVEGAEEELHVPASVSGLVLPLAVAIFKMNRGISATFQLIFLAHVFAVPLGVGDVAAFVATILLLSFGSVGVPGGGGGMRSLPAYLAAGIPLQGYLLANASETIPDIFKTVLNVTADMAVACLAWGGPADATTTEAPGTE